MSSNSNTNGTASAAKKKVVVVKKVAGPPAKASGTTTSKIPAPSTTKTTTTNKSNQNNTTSATNTSTKASSTESNQTKPHQTTTSTKVTPQSSQLSNSSDQSNGSTKPKTTALKATAVPKATKVVKKAQPATKVTQAPKSTTGSSTAPPTSESNLAPPKSSGIKPPTPRGTTAPKTEAAPAPATKSTTTAVPKIDVTAAKPTTGIKAPTPRTPSPREPATTTPKPATAKKSTPAVKATTTAHKDTTEPVKKTTAPAAKTTTIAVPTSSAPSALKPPTPRGTTPSSTQQAQKPTAAKVVVAHKVQPVEQPKAAQPTTTPRKTSDAPRPTTQPEPATPKLKAPATPATKTSGIVPPTKTSPRPATATQPKGTTPRPAEQAVEKPASPENARPLGASSQIKRVAGPQRKASTKNLKANVEKISQNAGTTTRERDAFTTKYIGEAVGAMGLIAALGLPKKQGSDDDANLQAKSMVFIPANEVKLKASVDTENEKNTNKLIHIKGRRRIAVRQVECHYRALNDGDSFILDAGQILYNWNGKSANKMEIAKAFDVAKRMNTKEKGSRAQVIVFNQKDNIDVATDHQYQKFWKLLAYEGPSNTAPQIADQSVAGIDEDIDKKDFKDKLYKISENENYNPNNNGNTTPGKGKSPRSNDLFKIEAIHYDKLGQELLDPRYVFLLDCTSEFYIWSGKQAAHNMRKWAQDKAKILFGKAERPAWTRTTKENDGAESILFKEKFWNFQDELPIMKKMEIVSNVAAKREEKFNVNTMYNPPAHKPEQAIDDGHGQVMKMWRVDMNDKQDYPLDMSGHFFMEDSFIIWYQYKEAEKQLYASSQSLSLRQKDKHILYFWQGRNSGIKKKGWSAVLTADLGLTNFQSGESMQLRVPQQMETTHFHSLYKGNIIVHKGSFVEYQQSYSDRVHMYQIRGRPNTDLRVIEVTPECRSLNTNDLFLILYEGKFVAWLGKACHIKDHSTITHIAASVIRQEGSPIEFINEGHETDEMWDLLGGQAAYFKMPFKHIRLFHCHLGSGMFQAEYIFDICQDELVEKDLMILDTSDIVFVWKGSKSSETKEKHTLELAVEYVTNDPRWNRAETPIYLVESGHEPYMFTGFFHGWDYAKSKSSPEVDSLQSVRALVKEFNRTYTLEELKQKPKGLDPQRYEFYLTDEEFFAVFEMGKEAYEQIPQWKKDILRKKHGLY